MKRFTKIALIASAVLILCGLAVFTAGALLGGIRDLRNSGRVYALAPANTSAPVDESTPSETSPITVSHSVSGLRLELSSETVRITTGTAAAPRISFFPEDGRTYACTEDPDGTAVFTCTSSQGFVGFDFSLVPDREYDILVEIPTGWAYPLTVNTDSGDVSLVGTLSDSLSVTAYSGEVEISGSVSGALTISVDSGEVELSAGTFGDTEISTDSGSIDMEHGNFLGDIRLESGSGEISMEGCTAQGGLAAKTGSGEVEVESCTISGNITVSTDSGDVELILSGVPAHTITKASSDSGTVHLDPSVPGGTATISVTTDSGDIFIQEF